MSAISERLRKAYEKKGLSYQELSKLCRVPRATIQRYVMGATDRIDIDKLCEICRVLGVDTADVIGWEKGSKKADLDGRFGEELKKERKMRNWSLEKMSNELGTTPDVLCAYEEGRRIPKFSTAVIWAIQLGIPLSSYDPLWIKKNMEVEEPENVDVQILRLINSLSQKSKEKAMAYLQGLKDNENNH